MPQLSTRIRSLTALGVVIVAAAFAVISFAQHHHDWEAPPEAKSVHNPFPPTPDSVAAGKAAYQISCAKCHGQSGDGKTTYARWHSVKPADLSDADHMAEMTDGELFWKITEGKKPMPSFKTKLSDEQRWQIVDYIRTLAAPAPSASQPPR